MEGRHDIIEFPLQVLAKIGIFSRPKSKRVSAIAGFYVLITVFLACTCLLQFVYIKGDITELTFNSEALGGFLQVGVKFFVVAYQQNDLHNLVKSTKSFWKTTKCSPELKLELDNMSTKILKLERIFLACMLISASMSDISVFFGRSVPLGIWKVDGSQNLYYLYVVTIMMYMLLIATFLGAFDALFMGMCAESVTQFRILCYCISQDNKPANANETNGTTYSKNFKICIQYHQFLLGFLKALRRMYSPVLFAQYISSSSLICVDMYALLEVKNTALRARQGILVTTQILQMAFYCVATEVVTNEALEVSNAIYSSGWYLRNSTSLRSILTIATQRSQHQNYFKAGGLVDINSAALLTVIKASWSICTVMRRLKKENPL